MRIVRLAYNELLGGAALTGLPPAKGSYKDVLRADPCSYCGRKLPPPQPNQKRRRPTVDHIVPRKRHAPVEERGPNHWSNLTSACSSCNYRRDRTPLLLFLLRIHRERANKMLGSKKKP